MGVSVKQSGKKNFKCAKKYLPFSYLSVTQSVEKKIESKNVRRANRLEAHERVPLPERHYSEIDDDGAHNGAFVQEAAHVTAARLVP
jgi:hypothetical protein